MFVVAVSGAALAGWWYARESSPHQGPIVLISVDGLRPGPTAGPDGSSTATPPRSRRSHRTPSCSSARTAHSPLTFPAHASLLAGQLPFEHGVRDEAGFALKEDARSLAELLRNRGFETGAAVSSFLLRRESGVAQGFSFFDAELPDQAGAPRRWSNVTVRRRRTRPRDGFVPGAGTASSSSFRSTGTRPNPPSPGWWPSCKDLGFYSQATILLTADRGETGAGMSLDDSSLHVPLLVKQPDGEGAGHRVALPVQHIDLLPTVLDLVRAPIPSGLRGRSLRAVLGGDETGVAEQPIYAESLAGRFRFGGPGKFALATRPRTDTSAWAVTRRRR